MSDRAPSPAGAASRLAPACRSPSATAGRLRDLIFPRAAAPPTGTRQVKPETLRTSLSLRAEHRPTAAIQPRTSLARNPDPRGWMLALTRTQSNPRTSLEGGAPPCHLGCHPDAHARGCASPCLPTPVSKSPGETAPNSERCRPRDRNHAGRETRGNARRVKRRAGGPNRRRVAAGRAGRPRRDRWGRAQRAEQRPQFSAGPRWRRATSALAPRPSGTPSGEVGC